MSSHPRLDVHQAITDSIISAIEAGTDGPSMPWHRSGASGLIPTNAATSKAYNGINILALWAACEVRGYTRSLWGTYKQWQSLDAQVRKGERACLVVFYKEFEVEPQADDDDGHRAVARASWVFNAAQVDGYTLPAEPAKAGPIERLATADAFVASTRANIQIGGDSAFYRRSTDHIQMPDEHRFFGPEQIRTENWYCVLGHELTHWAGADKRLNRTFGIRFGDDAYCMEELTAELGSAFLMAQLGITPQLREDHAHYIGHWLRVLKADKRAVFAAAAKASEAVRYLTSLQQEG